MNHRRLDRITRISLQSRQITASVSIFTQVQCGQKGASSRDFQNTVSTLVIFIGAIVCAATAYFAARGEASKPDTNERRFIFIAPILGTPIHIRRVLSTPNRKNRDQNT